MGRYLALGDSYTIGEGVGEAERWPMRVVALLRERGVEVDDPLIVATTGWTTDELVVGIEAAPPEGAFSLVTLLIGVNNQYRGRPLEEYRAQFAGLLERATGFAGGAANRVVVVSIPDWGVTPFAEGRDRVAIAREIDAFNLVNRDEAERRGAAYVDVTAASRAMADSVVGDGLHPDGVQYEAWAALVMAAALPVLR